MDHYARMQEQAAVVAKLQAHRSKLKGEAAAIEKELRAISENLAIETAEFHALCERVIVDAGGMTYHDQFKMTA